MLIKPTKYMMNDTDILAIIDKHCKFYAKEHFQRDLPDIKLTDRFEEDLGLDSLARISALTGSAQEMGIKIINIGEAEAEKIDGAKTIEQAIVLCRELL